jgi:predicted O-linked N-acetylglucosamine transferase (SPINDLY family)
MPTILEALTMGRQQQQAGNLRGAEHIYRQILQADRAQVDAWYLLGTALQTQGRLVEAEECLRQAVQLRPDVAEIHNMLGTIQALRGKAAEAEKCFREVLLRKPEQASAYSNLGNVLRDLGRFDEAVACCREAIRLKPDYAEAFNNLGNALRDQGRLEESESALRQALRLRPQYPRALNNLGAVLASQRRWTDAVVCYREALRLQPDFYQAYNNLGVTYAELREPDKALAAYREAIRLRPDFASAYNNLGIVYLEQWQMEDALGCYEKALQIDPNYADAHNQIAMVYMALGKIEPSLRHYRRSLELKPDDPRVHSNMLLCLHYVPDLSNQELFEEHLRWDQAFGQVERLGPAPDHDRDPDRRLRIGYLSPDFRKHAVTYFFEPILASHDPQQVETFCYAQVEHPDAVTIRLQSLAHHWRSAVGKKDSDVAEMIRQDRVDILVDLAGHAGNRRMRVFAYKPASVQVTYLGYPDTTGLRTMDYRLTDAVADPPGAETPCTEELYRLPEGFCTFQAARDSEISPLPYLRNGYFTFGSVHGLAKLHGGIYDAWARILNAVPNARLFLHRSLLKGKTLEAMLRDLERHGIAGDRITTGSDADAQGDFLRIYDHIDLCLDSFPYNGHTTMCESLWMGVPIVTLAGNRFAGRVTASLLHRVGLDDLIARTPQEYIEKAVAWASHCEQLAALRPQLRERMKQTALGDRQRFTRQLEEAYRAIWRRWVSRF